MANVGLAFGLVIGAGLCTGVGAGAVFSNRLMKAASKTVLASSLSFSAGIMIYVSFVEIFQKSVGAFEESGYEKHTAYLYATLCFFGGCLIMKILGYAVGKLTGLDDDHGHHGHACPTGHFEHHFEHNQVPTDKSKVVSTELNSAEQPGQPDKQEEHVLVQTEQALVKTEQPSADNSGDVVIAVPTPHSEEGSTQVTEEDGVAIGDKKLIKMGLNTALAIGIHNFPEGLATFVGALDDPAVGASLALAIAMHNIPEGLCVAVPIYFATGNRKKAFMWGILSGISEPIGALFGWLVLANVMGQAVYGLLFGMVGGMMTMIVMAELLPTAHRYDPDDKYVTNCFVAGMAFMAISLVLFMF